MEFRRVLYRSLLADLREAAATSYPVKAERLAALSNPGNVAAEIQRRIAQLILPSFDDLVTQLDEFYESGAPDGVGRNTHPGGKAERNSVREGKRVWVRVEPDVVREPQKK